MEHQYPRVTDAVIISQKSERIFTSLFPPESWSILKVHGENDFGVDFKIEIVTDKEITGYEFYVQLKGFRELEPKSEIAVQISTSTLGYWKNKIIPVLVVAIDCNEGKAYCQWFDKLTEIKHQQKTQTINIPKANELKPTELRVYIEAYYRGFIEAVKDIRVYAFYKHLFYNSVWMSAAIDNKFIAFLYPPKLSKKELEKHNQRYLGAFVQVFAKIIYDLKIYKIDLPDEPIHKVIEEFIGKLFEIHREICIKEVKDDSHDLGEIYTITVDAAKAHTYLPVLSKMFSEINLFFVKFFLRYDELHREQTFVLLKKNK